MHTYHIHIEGQVQGVGFRPFVYSLAHRFGLKGWVNNRVDGVHVEFNAGSAEALAFYKALLEEAPRLAKITAHHLVEVEKRQYEGFQIVHSGGQEEASLLITPDFALCADCRRELLDPENRRYQYPFITCTNCGPRYSIISALPYDRERTSMAAFTMCPACSREYHDPLDRRYFSQTNSCGDCGIRLALYNADGDLITWKTSRAIEKVAAAIRQGAIVAVKGIGGYLLCCDATLPRAIRLLRARKARPAKPLAVLYPGLEELEKDAFLSPEAIRLLQSPVAPILLLQTRTEQASGIAMADIAPGMDQIGAMVPYTPLFTMLMDRLQRPVVATSGNVSNSPIIFREKDALRQLGSQATLILTDNRPIAVPQDDSVIRLSPLKRQQTVLRRSRGMAPTFVQPDLELPHHCVLAMGAELKSSFTLLHRQNTYISQFLGDLDNFDTQQHFHHTLEHLVGLLKARPELVIVDKHPGYFATQLGEEYAEEWGVEIVRVQHHKAHFAAVLAENKLLDQPEPVLGIVWDGTGFGDDGHIWGGETFVYREKNITRIGHLAYFDFLLGDKMPREPRISALALLHSLEGGDALLRPKFSEAEWRVYQNVLDRHLSLKTSSVGRLFDAVASLLGLIDRSTYEGEAAMLLEQAGWRFVHRNGVEAVKPYPVEPLLQTDRCINGQSLLLLILKDLKGSADREEVAARFHATLARLVHFLAEATGVQLICCSGGVFQNALLIDLLLHYRRKDVKLYFHRQLPPNDESISFGQLVHQLMEGGSLTKGKAVGNAIRLGGDNKP